MKHKLVCTGLMIGAILLTGCSGGIDSISVNTMTINKDGTIADVSVEDFSEGSYDMADLESFVTGEIADYNAENGEGSITLDELQTESKLVKLKLTYADIEDYNAFNHTEYELSAFEDANLSGEFTSAADGSQVKATDMDDTDMKVLKVGDAMNISCKGKVLYYNTYITENDGTYSATGEGLAVIIFK